MSNHRPFSLMTVFRPCPSYPGYEAAADGTIRRLSWVKVTKTGREIVQPASIVAHVGRDRAYVALVTGWQRWSVLVADAWPDAIVDRPAPLYAGARVLTVAEWKAEKACHAPRSESP